MNEIYAAVGAITALIVTAIALYKFIMKAVDEKIDLVVTPVKELAEEALDKGIAIETNYRAQFKETNANVQATREQVLERFGKTEGTLHNVESMVKIIMDRLPFLTHGDKQ